MADDAVWQYLDTHPEDYDTFKIGHRHWTTYKALLLLVTHMLYGDDADLLTEKNLLKRIIQSVWILAIHERINIAIDQYGWYINTVYKWNPTRTYERIGCAEPWANSRDKQVVVVYDEKPVYISPYLFQDEWMKERRVYAYEAKNRWLRWRKFVWAFIQTWGVILFYLVDWLVCGFYFSNLLKECIAFTLNEEHWRAASRVLPLPSILAVMHQLLFNPLWYLDALLMQAHPEKLKALQCFVQIVCQCYCQVFAIFAKAAECRSMFRNSIMLEPCFTNSSLVGLGSSLPDFLSKQLYLLSVGTVDLISANVETVFISGVNLLNKIK